MRAQFATLEALVALLISVSVVSSFSVCLALVPNQEYGSRAGLATATAEYDLMNGFMRNASESGCLDLYLSGSSAPCLDRLMGEYAALYGIGSLSLVASGVQQQAAKSGSGPEGTAACFPYQYESVLYTICFESGD